MHRTRIAVGLSLVLWALGQGSSSAQSRLVTISSPSSGAIVKDDAVEVSGVYAPKMADDIWVLVWPGKAPKKFWPQSDEADEGRPATKRDGKWSVGCSLGGPDQSYEIAVYTASQAASAELSTMLKEWAKANKYPGSTRLPSGLTEQHRITVQKRR